MEFKTYTIKEIDVPVEIVGRVLFSDKPPLIHGTEGMSGVLSGKLMELLHEMCAAEKRSIYIGVLKGNAIGHNYFQDNIALFNSDGKAIRYNEIYRKLFDLDLSA